MPLERALELDRLGKAHALGQVNRLRNCLEQQVRLQPHDLELAARLINLYISLRFNSAAQRLLAETVAQHGFCAQLAEQVLIPTASAWVDGTLPKLARKALGLMPYSFYREHPQQGLIELRIGEAEDRQRQEIAVDLKMDHDLLRKIKKERKIGRRAERPSQEVQALALAAKLDRLRQRWPEAHQRLSFPDVSRYGRAYPRHQIVPRDCPWR